MSDARRGPSGPELAPSLPESLPSSAQTVYEILAVEGPLTHRELVELAEMPPRTVRYAISRLKEGDHIGERRNLMDSRQRFFFVNHAPGSANDAPRGSLTKLGRSS